MRRWLPAGLRRSLLPYRDRTVVALSAALRRSPVPSTLAGPPKHEVDDVERWASGATVELTLLEPAGTLGLHEPVSVEPLDYYDMIYRSPRVRTVHRGPGGLSYDVPPRYVATIPQGRAVGCDGAIVSGRDELILPLSPEFDGLRRIPGRHSVMTRLRLPKPKRIEGTVAVLATLADTFYSHWMLEMLPRVQLLRAAGYDPADLDGIYLRRPTRAFELESLEAAGVPIDRIVDCRANPHVVADRLVVPSTLREVFEATTLSCDYLNDLFPVVPDGEPTRLYLSRSGTTHRRMVNEEEIVAALEPLGFVTVRPETMSVADQARAFAGAEAVVAPLGSAMANYVFCRPGAAIVEMQNPRTTHTCSAAVAGVRGLRYGLLYGTGVAPGASPLEEDMEVDVGAVLRTLEAVGVA
jgi:capsular polysaccharide biosynthesis protein